MSVFSVYSRYYDLLYRDKNYADEATFVHNLLKKYAPNIKFVLDLGCGTGLHAIQLAKKGLHVKGVDLSQDMLETAQKRQAQLSRKLSMKLEFFHGDIRSIRFNKQYDAVISLFHVMSYQTTNNDLLVAFNTAKAHLNPGGIFIFDCWYGPAVLSDRPSVRLRRLENDKIKVVRVADPVMYLNNNVVDVNYQVFITNKNNEFVEELRETHKMRYLFQPEVDLLFSQTGFELITCREWMTDSEPGAHSWGVYFIARAI